MRRRPLAELVLDGSVARVHRRFTKRQAERQHRQTMTASDRRTSR